MEVNTSSLKNALHQVHVHELGEALARLEHEFVDPYIVFVFGFSEELVQFLLPLRVPCFPGDF